MISRRPKAWLTACFLVAELAVAGRAHAQSSARDPAAAQALFDAGKQAYQAGHYAEACPKLAESQRLDPAGGTLLLLAMCHEGEGKTATAWAEFDEAASVARTDRRPDREGAANEHLHALEARLTRVTIQVTDPVDGLELHRDDVLIGKAQWGTPLPIDPGVHALRATAPGKKAWSGTLPVPAEAKSFVVNIPKLEDEAKAPPAAPPPAAAAPPPHHDDETKPEEGSDGSTQRTIALVTGGVGVVALGIGVGFGLSASSKWKDVEKACPGLRCQTTNGPQEASDAGHAADISTVSFIVGGVALAGAAVLYFTAPHGKPAESTAVRVTPMLGPRVAGLGLTGSL